VASLTDHDGNRNDGEHSRLPGLASGGRILHTTTVPGLTAEALPADRSGPPKQSHSTPSIPTTRCSTIGISSYGRPRAESCIHADALWQMRLRLLRWQQKGFRGQIQLRYCSLATTTHASLLPGVRGQLHSIEATSRPPHIRVVRVDSFVGLLRRTSAPNRQTSTRQQYQR
jgi:hypothetical protein